jgi:hypothetical protein
MKQSSLLALTTVFTLALHAQTFRNLDFKQNCDSSKTGLCYWDLAWGDKGSVVPAMINKTSALEITGKSTNSVGFTEQTSIAKKITGINIIQLSADIRSENVEGKGAGLDIQLYDKDNSLVAFKDMGGFYSVSWIQGTTGWKRYSISLVCPIETWKIKIGAILYGKGKAWFKNYKVNFFPIADRKPSKLAIKYISAACDTILQHSLLRDSLDMETLKQNALKIAGPAKKYSDCYLAVNYLLESLRPLGDEHSFFMTPEEVINLQGAGSNIVKIENPTFKIISDCGYIIVPPFHGGNPQRKLEYADSLQSAIKKLYPNVKGWIIDLRGNTGGDMEPMIMGLGPLFSAEKLGALVDVNGQPDSWYYKQGKYFWDDGYLNTLSDPVVLTSSLPIAVLTSGQTGSSGEAVVVSFIGNASTKFFGQPTWGLTTGNGSFDMMDGANIHLASTVYADRNGKKYYGPIQPDIIIEPTTKKDDDPVLIAAIDWIKKN